MDGTGEGGGGGGEEGCRPRSATVGVGVRGSPRGEGSVVGGGGGAAAAAATGLILSGRESSRRWVFLGGGVGFWVCVGQSVRRSVDTALVRARGQFTDVM